MSVKGTPRGSDENLTASSDSFWDVGNYRRTVKRIDDGAKLCDELMKLVAERAEIEAKYAAKLKNWAKKWEEVVKLGPEYNSMEEAMKGTVTEANSRSDVHTKCRDELMNGVHEMVKKWKSESYHKSLFQWKETKEAEDGFSRAQKPWAKFLMKVMRAKKAYHTATKAKELAEKQVSDATNDVNFPQEKIKKLEDVVAKKEDEMEKCKAKYERRIDEITNDYNDTYSEGMARQFEKCQEFEEKRLQFFKETLMKYYQCLNIADIPEFSGIFVQMSTTFQMANSHQDLDWWSRFHGTGMLHNWPVFEEYDENQVGPKSSQASNVYISNTNQMQTTSYNDMSTNDYTAPPSPPPAYNHVNDVIEPAAQYQEQDQENTFNQDEEFDEQAPDDWGTEPPEVEVGVPVRALFDYDGAEEDELTFKAGDILTKLTEKDEQGWCNGRFGGKVALFPGDYTEPL